MATTTINGHVSRALDFFEHNDMRYLDCLLNN